MTTPWTIASLVMFVALLPCVVACLRGTELDRLVALETAATILCLLLVCLAQAWHRTFYYDLAIALAILAFGGGLVFTRFLERWL